MKKKSFKRNVYLLVLLISGLFPYYTQAQGNIWGMTEWGGADNKGVIFTTDSNGNNFNVRYSFKIDTPGNIPSGCPIQASNGKFFCMTNAGGYNNRGILYEYDPASSAYSKKVDFSGPNGAEPEGSLIQASNGKLYGMTTYGGTRNFGVIFEYDPATSIYTQKLKFDSVNSGANPYGSLLQASNGLLYGLTFSGGANNRGVLFEYN